jgi:3-hydroxyisobutyrate dehydrogenase
MRVGFLGLGLMGTPMALNLARAGVDLTVWNRTPEKTEPLRAAGARVAASPAELIAGSDVVIAMLAGAEAIDAVLGRGGPEFAALGGRTLVHMGTTAPAYSAGLAHDVEAVGGSYVEAPVSGSRVPAERGELAGMIAGEPEAVARVRPLLDPLCATVVECGAVPKALTTKLAVNVFLITLVTGLAESFHFATEHGLDLERFVEVLDNGQMASPISRVKLAKLLGGDLSPQASLADVLQNSVLIDDAARAEGVATPLMSVCLDLYREALTLGPNDDMVGVIRAVRGRARQHSSDHVDYYENPSGNIESGIRKDSISKLGLPLKSNEKTT